MKAIFYFILGVFSIVFISQNQPNQNNKSTFENGVSTQQLLQINGEKKTASKLSNQTVENYLRNYLSNYTTSNTTNQTFTSTKKKISNTNTNTHKYSQPVKQNSYNVPKSTSYKKRSKSNYSYSKAKSSNSTYQPVKYKKAQPTELITYYSNSFGETVQSPTRYTGKPSGATAICRDGTYSFSQNRRGTCSRHGGVSSWL